MCSGIMTWGREVLALIKESPSEASSPHQPQSKSKQSSWCWSRCKNSHTESSSRGIWDSLGDLLEPRQDWCSWGPYETKLLHSCIRDYHPTLEVTQSLHQSSAPLLPISWPILRVPLGARHWTRHREITEGDIVVVSSDVQYFCGDEIKDVTTESRSSLLAPPVPLSTYIQLWGLSQRCLRKAWTKLPFPLASLVPLLAADSGRDWREGRTRGLDVYSPVPPFLSKGWQCLNIPTWGHNCPLEAFPNSYHRTKSQQLSSPLGLS